MLPDPLAVIGIFMLGASAGSLVTYARYRQIIDGFRRALECSFVNVTADDGARPSCGMKALIVARDAEMVGIFSRLFHEIQVETQECACESEAIDLSARTLILDQCPSKNLAANTSKSIFIGKGRLALELPVSIRKKSGTLLQRTMFDLNQNGMAVSTPSSFGIGEQLNIVFAILNSDASVRADGTVIWDDRHGKAGIRFRCTSSSVQERLFEWLHASFSCGSERGTQKLTC